MSRPLLLLLATAAAPLAMLSAQESCRAEDWNVSPLGGPHLQVAAQLSLVGGDSARAAAALAQLALTPARLGTQRVRLERGRADGYTAARDNVLRVLEQLAQLQQDIDRSLDAPPGAATALLRDSVRPAVQAYAGYLRETYLADARANGGLSSLPTGAQCYRERFQLITGVETAPETLAALARSRIAAVDAELAPVLQRLVGSVPLAEAKRRVRTEARFLHTSRDEMLTEARALEARLTPAVARMFHNPPAVPLEIVPTPAVRERSDAPARYGSPTGPGQPGTFFLNTFQPESQPRWNLPVAVAHEGAPGHHFERTYPRPQATSLAEPTPGLGSYIEGWGMYAEELAVRESGVLDDDLARAGFLLHFLDAWNALELDVRMHLDGWTREQVIARTIEVTGKSRTVAAVYADRHAAAPGQLASYMVGYHALRTMREEAEQVLGTRFDIRDFHERVLEAGPQALPAVHARVREWVSAAAAAGPRP